MFGMESGKKKKSIADYSFDLEMDLKDPAKLRAIKEKIETRVMQLKRKLREGGDKKDFDQTQTLLYGYLTLQKVVQRVNRKMF